MLAVVAVAELPVQLPDEPDTLPVISALIVAGSLIVAFSEPSKLAPVPVFVADESCMLIVLAVSNFVAVAELPLRLPVNLSAFKYCVAFVAELKSGSPLIAPLSIIGSVKGVNKTFPPKSVLEPTFENPIFSTVIFVISSR